MSFNNLDSLASSRETMMSSRSQRKAFQSQSFVKMPKLVVNGEQPVPKHILLEKKKVYVQNNVHQNILNMGEGIHKNFVNTLEKRFEIKEKELAEKFGREKLSAIEKERNKIDARIEQLRLEIKADYDRLFQEKCAEIEAYNQSLSKQQVELARLEEKRQAENMLDKVRDKLVKEKKTEIEKIIDNEQKIARLKMEDQRRTYERKIDETNELWIKKMNDALSEIKAKMLKENEKAVQMAIIQTKYEEQSKLEQCKDSYEKKLEDLRGEIKERLEIIVQLNSRIGSFEHENSELKHFIDELRAEFQRFFEQFLHMKNGEAGFVFLKQYIAAK